ncbi:MAG: extracellular solute-binding protein [Chloroflexi bacterium]|nr:extracellular solute-binding protein [Chloroflexota bacterium]
MRKSMFAVLAVIALLIAACGPSATPAPTTAPAAQPTTAAVSPTKPPAVPTTAPVAPTTAPTAAAVKINNPPASAAEVDAIVLAGKNVQVTYWHNRPQKDQDLLQSMLDEFNKSNPYGIKAKAEIAGSSYNDVYNKVNAALQANQPPEISVAYQNQAAFYRGQNAVIDLTPFVKSTKYGISDADMKDYIQTFLDSDKNPQFKNEVLGFPTQRSMEVMFVNLDALKKLGYDGAPKDWKTFEEAACKFAKDNPGKYGWDVGHDASRFAARIFARGGRILAPDGQSYVFNSQAGVDDLSMVARLLQNKCAVEIPTSESFGNQNRFGNGDLLMTMGSSSGLPFFQQAVDKGGKFKWDIALLPGADQPNAGMDLYGASVSVYKTTPEKELAAWLVIKFLGEKTQTTKWALATGYLPVRQSAKADVIAGFKADKTWGPVADSYAKMFDWTKYSLIESPVAGYDPVRLSLDKDVVTKLIQDPKSDVKALLDAAKASADKVLKENAPK